MAEFQVEDPDFAARVRESFSRQTIMALLGASLARVAPGEVEIRLPYRADLAQQRGFVHAGVVTTIVDSACGYSALTLLPPGLEVLSVEFKVNFLRPAAGEWFVARGEVVKPGRTITITRGDVWAESDGQEKKLIATMLATMIRQ